MLGFICFLCVFVPLLVVDFRRHAARRIRERQALESQALTKELASWDKVKELGFDDVLDWERAFEKATGALSADSRVKELEKEYQQNKILMESQMLAGAPIRVGPYTQVRKYTVVPGIGAY